MSIESQIADLIGQYTALKSRYESRIGEIDSAVATALKTIPQQRRLYYVDTGGDDNADGSGSSPLATIEEAVNRTPLGGHLEVRCAENQVHTWTGSAIGIRIDFESGSSRSITLAPRNVGLSNCFTSLSAGAVLKSTDESAFFSLSRGASIQLGGFYSVVIDYSDRSDPDHNLFSIDYRSSMFESIRLNRMQINEPNGVTTRLVSVSIAGRAFLAMNGCTLPDTHIVSNAQTTALSNSTTLVG